MKNVPALLIALMLFTLNAKGQGTVKRSDTRVTDVTVYRQGARIFSEKKVEVPAGNSLLQFYGIAADADPGSIQVMASGPVTIKSVNLEQDFIAAREKKPEVVALEKAKKTLSSKLTEHKTQLEVLDKEMQFLTVNMPMSTPSSAAKLADIISAGQYFSKKTEEIITEKQWRNDSVTSLSEKISLIDKQIAELSGDVNRPVTMAVIQLEAREKTTALFHLNYLVMQAGWHPSYDLRVHSIAEPIELNYRANVYQSTGIEWNQVKLRLSSANPQQSGILPVLQPYRLDYIRMQPTVVGYGIQSKSIRIRGISKAEENEAFDLAASQPVPFVETERQTVVEFEPVIPYTIPSNGNNYVVDIRTAEIPATYSYLAIPKIDPQVHLRARLTGWESLHLLEGDANVFYEGAFTGKTFINPGNLTDTLQLSLGTDRAVSVVRETDRAFTEKRFLSSKVEETKGWKITVRNNKSQKITLELIDQVPLSSQSEIEVSGIETGGGKFNSQTGEVKWSFDLAPAARMEKKISYAVRYPKGEMINIE